MSSHHIVRDEQEPAIIITDMKPNYWRAIDQLLGWSPTVIVAAQCVDIAMLKGIKLDVVIGATQQLEEVESLLLDQQPVRTLDGGTETILKTAIQYLLKKEYRAVNIFGSFESSLYQKMNINTIWYDHHLRYVKSTNHIFKKWLPEDSVLFILPFDNKQSFKLEGLTHIKDHEYQSNISGIITITSNIDFWIGEIY